MRDTQQQYYASSNLKLGQPARGVKVFKMIKFSIKPKSTKRVKYETSKIAQ
jgi:hypothetical protein